VSEQRRGAARASTRLRCVSCGGALRPTHRFCPNCGTPVGSTPQPQPAIPPPSLGGPALQVSSEPSVDLSENRRLVTVLFADIIGSTPLGERLDPEDLRRILASFFAALAHEIQRYGGTVDKFIGDAVMAVFGAPVAHEDDAERAISAGIAMQAAIGQLNEDLQRRYGQRLALRVGINTGEVVAGLLSGEMQAYTVVGDTVNTARRFESAAEPGSILVGQATRELTRRAFDFEALPPLVLKGKAEPQKAFRVLGARYESVDPASMPLVGRASELSTLRQALDEATLGRGRMVHLVGEAGIGKSRLVRELRGGSAPDVIQVVGRCVSFEANRPLALLARLIRDVVRVPTGNDERAARAGIEAVLSQVGQDVDPLDTALLLDVLGYGERSTVDPQSRQRVLLRLIRRLLSAFAQRAPVLIVAEDLHWADPGSCALLADLARDIPQRRCLLVSTARPGLPAPWPAEVVALEALPQSVARALIESAFGGEVEESLAERILTRTSGNPFFIEEVVRELREANVVVQDNGRVTARPGVTPRVPTTVQEVLLARLDRLEPAAKRVLQIAAVCGRVFRQRVVERLVPDVTRADSLTQLERESFILSHAVQPEPTYAFRHALIQEVVYNGQLHAQRRVTHAAIGEALEVIYADRLDEMLGELAFHYGQSANDAKALFWLVRAGDRAKALFANTEALTQYRAALERAGDGGGPLDATTILEHIGEVQTHIGSYDAAIESFRSAIQRSGLVLGSLVARLHRRVGAAFMSKGAFAEAGESLAAARSALVDIEDPEPARLELQLGQLQYRRGEFAAAREALQRAVRLGARFELEDLVAEGLKELGNVALDTGDLKAAADFYQQSRKLYERLENLVGLADLHSNLGILFRRAGRWDDALAEYRSALGLRERMGHLFGIGTCYNNLAEVHRSRGDLEAAIASYQQAIETLGSIGNASGVAVALIGLGAARIGMGAVDGGRADLLDAQQRFQAIGSTIYFPDLFRYLAEAELGAGDIEAAEQAAAHSLEYSRAGKARHQEAATLRVLGEIALARGEPEAARALLEVSRETLRKLGDTLEMARAEEVLAKLEGH
jgi:adenylate cyclase